jgi:hypothetical protein
VVEKVTQWWKLDVNLIKSVDHENEVNVTTVGDICLTEMYTPW